ncbi:DoxX family protein [Dyadobacter endophyticus]|uniref:DoxX family protein n=1 Tax=Dyadobacter endophyticus TaxID=1749036 RepID=UPI003CECAEFD
MHFINSTFLLRFAVIVILLAHSVPGMFDHGINDFGNLYLNQVGFAPVGVPIAWAIKLSHVLCAICLLFQKYVRWVSGVTILILLAGIIMVHFKEGWFVVGGGRNGVEFNFLLMFVLLTIMFPAGLNKYSGKG